MNADVPASRAHVGRQVVLPVRKAAEIAWQSIRLRLARSLLVTSGIVLAIAFLMAVLTSEAMTDSMRRWVASGPAAEALGRQKLESIMPGKALPPTPQE